MTMKRYEKFVIEAEEGITFEFSKGANGVLFMKAKAQNTGEANSYPETHENHTIPKGYKYVRGEWNNGVVIERRSDGRQFVWVPEALAGELTSQFESLKEHNGFCFDDGFLYPPSYRYYYSPNF